MIDHSVRNFEDFINFIFSKIKFNSYFINRAGF